MYQTLDAIDGK